MSSQIFKFIPPIVSNHGITARIVQSNEQSILYFFITGSSANWDLTLNVLPLIFNYGAFSFALELKKQPKSRWFDSFHANNNLLQSTAIRQLAFNYYLPRTVRKKNNALPANCTIPVRHTTRKNNRYIFLPRSYGGLRAKTNACVELNSWHFLLRLSYLKHEHACEAHWWWHCCLFAAASPCRDCVASSGPCPPAASHPSPRGTW
jgi:hypothetical protein